MNEKSQGTRIRALRPTDNLIGTTHAMKCNKCAKQATFHITDLTGDGVLALHLCPDCAKHYLQTEDNQKIDASAMSSVLGKQISPLSKATEEMQDLDSRECPICGISFYEFRQGGRLGCPHDYVFLVTNSSRYCKTCMVKMNTSVSNPNEGSTTRNRKRN